MSRSLGDCDGSVDIGERDGLVDGIDEGKCVGDIVGSVLVGEDVIGADDGGNEVGI